MDLKINEDFKTKTTADQKEMTSEETPNEPVSLWTKAKSVLTHKATKQRTSKKTANKNSISEEIWHKIDTRKKS